MSPEERFIDALKDYRYLIERNYPQKTILQLIGTRHSLSRAERSTLYRGIFTPAEAESRKLKLAGTNAITGTSLHIDGFNVLFTVSSYLQGVSLYLADDGLLRDTLEGHGKGISMKIFTKSVALTGEYLQRSSPSGLAVYLDRQIEEKYLAEKLILAWSEHIPDLKIILDDSPDRLMRKVNTGCIATSDSGLINQTGIPVVDLARAVIVHFFHPGFTNLAEYGK